MAAATGLPDWLIQSLGKWKSDTYVRYIRTPSTPQEDAATIMARAAHTAIPSYKGMSSVMSAWQGYNLGLIWGSQLAAKWAYLS